MKKEIKEKIIGIIKKIATISNCVTISTSSPCSSTSSSIRGIDFLKPFLEALKQRIKK